MSKCSDLQITDCVDQLSLRFDHLGYQAVASV